MHRAKRVRTVARVTGGLALLGLVMLAVGATGPGHVSALELMTGTNPVYWTFSFHTASHGQPGSATVGVPVHLQVLLENPQGGQPVPSGTIEFQGYATGSCAGTPQATASVALVDGIADGPTAAVTPATVIGVCFRAIYTGDAIFAAGTKTTSLEVRPGTATIVSRVHNAAHATVTTVPAGTPVHQSIVVAGGGVTPSGKIKQRWYQDGTCTGAYFFVEATLLNGSLEAPLTQTPTTPGTYAFQTEYLGDANYLSRLGPCQALTVTKATPVVTQAIHRSSHLTVTEIFIGSIVHDSAAVTGAAGTPTGTVTILYYSNPACDTPATQMSTATALINGAVDVTGFPVAPPVGTVTFQVNYSGSSTYISRSSGCQALKVNRFTPNMSTEVHNAAHAVVSEVSIGSFVHQRVALSGSGGPMSGTVTINVYPSANCTGTPEPLVATLVNGVIDGPFAMALNQPLARSLKAVYSGSAIYAPRTGSCDTVSWKAPSSIGSTLHDAGHDGGTTFSSEEKVHLRVVVDGAFSVPSGLVTLRRFLTADCTGPSEPQVATLSGGSSDASPGFQSPPGVYSQQATYEGSTTYFAKVGECKTYTIKAPVNVTVEAIDGVGDAISTIQLGSPYRFRARVSSPIGAPSGNVFFELFAGAWCGTPPTPELGTLSSGVALSAGQQPSLTGSYSVEVVFPGDATYFGGSSICRTITVTKATPTIATSLHDAFHQLVTGVPAGQSVHPLVHVEGAAGPISGMVTVNFYQDAACGGAVADTETAGLGSGTADIAALTVALTQGSHSFRATYLGDASYLARTGACTIVLGLAPGVTPPPLPSPSPTVAPTVAPSPTPISTNPLPSAATAAPGSSPDPSATVDPPASLDPSASAVPGSTAAAPGSSQAPGTTALPLVRGGSEVEGGTAILLGILAGAMIAMFAGGLAWRRRRSGAAVED